MGYTDNEEALRAEAMRVVPGVMGATARHEAVDAVQLVDDYHATATKLGITDAWAWSILWSATLHWTMELAETLATNQGIDMAELTQSLGRSALEWMVNERGVGGY